MEVFHSSSITMAGLVGSYLCTSNQTVVFHRSAQLRNSPVLYKKRHCALLDDWSLRTSPRGTDTLTRRLQSKAYVVSRLKVLQRQS
jgi:hypothetical protein